MERHKIGPTEHHKFRENFGTAQFVCVGSTFCNLRKSEGYLRNFPKSLLPISKVRGNVLLRSEAFRDSISLGKDIGDANVVFTSHSQLEVLAPPSGMKTGTYLGRPKIFQNNFPRFGPKSIARCCDSQEGWY